MYAWGWLTLECGLIARADDSVKSHVNHLQCRDDSIIVLFHKSNTNHDGLENNLPWNIHANPMLPHCCPVHAMGVYLFTNPNIINNNSRILPGEHQYCRYSYLLKKFSGDKKEDIANNENYIHHILGTFPKLTLIFILKFFLAVLCF